MAVPPSDAPRSYRVAPARTWPDHRGRPAPDAVYFVPPDPALGEVRSAWSNQTRSGFRRPPAKQIAMIGLGLAIVGAMLVFFLGIGVAWALDRLGLSAPLWAPYVGCAVIVAAVLAYLAKPRPICSYVGEEGVAEHSVHGLGRRDFVMRFADAASLTVGQTEKYDNGAYQGTEFALVWRDESGRVLLTLSGLRHDHGMWAQREIPGWDLACAAEARWNEIRWARAEDERRARGEATFRARDVVLAVGDGTLRIARSGGEDTLRPDDVESIALEEGMLVVRRAGATEGLFRSKGVDRFLVRDVQDLPVLLRALRRWGTFRVAS